MLEVDVKHDHREAFERGRKALDVLDSYGITYRVKFSGNSSPHIIIPEEAYQHLVAAIPFLFRSIPIAFRSFTDEEIRKGTSQNLIENAFFEWLADTLAKYRVVIVADRGCATRRKMQCVNNAASYPKAGKENQACGGIMSSKSCEALRTRRIRSRC